MAKVAAVNIGFYENWFYEKFSPVAEGEIDMSTTRDSRLVARVDTETQELIARAAELTGRSISQFLVYAAKKEAQHAEDQALRIRTSRESADRMLQMLDHPEPINRALRAAALDYGTLTDDFKNRINRKKT